MRATTRVGASICLSIFSLVSIILLLPSSQVSSQLQKIALGTTLDDFPTLWNWGTADDEWEADGDGVRLVVFGDSWVDDSFDETEGQGRSWAEVLCEVINCTSHLNFAVSQAPDAYPSSAPNGAITSSAIYVPSLSTSPSPPFETLPNELLPDLATQIQAFIALPPPSAKPRETLFLVSFGFWDVYNAAGLDYAMGQNVTDQSVNELFHQLDILYAHYSQNLSAAHTTAEESGDALNATEIEERGSKLPPFRVILPKLFDPTLTPGWISQRPVPLRPSSVAEEQKNAVYLASRWNTLVENRIGAFIKEPSPSFTPEDTIDPSETTEAAAPLPTIDKDVFYYDLPQYLLDIVVEHQLEDEGLSDASGLGKGDSPFESVYEPCVHTTEESEEGVESSPDLNGMIVCREPEEYMFWDSFHLGKVAKEGVGNEVGDMVRLGKSMRSIWKLSGTSSGSL